MGLYAQQLHTLSAFYTAKHNQIHNHSLQSENPLVITHTPLVLAIKIQILKANKQITINNIRPQSSISTSPRLFYSVKVKDNAALNTGAR